MTKGKAVAPATEDKAPKAQDPAVQPNGEDLTAMSDAIARQAEVLGQADEKIATLEAENDALKGVIKELNESLATKDTEIAATSKRPIHKHGKDTYEQVLPKFILKYKGKPVEVDEAMIRADKELLEELVKIKDGPLVKKGDK